MVSVVLLFVAGECSRSCKALQVLTSSSSCVDKPGHHTDCRALSRHFVIPWCPDVCILSRISFCSALGMTMRLPLMSIPSAIENSAASGR